MDPKVLAVTPAGKPPPGVKPDFIPDGELHVLLTATVMTCMAVSTVVVALRMFARTVVIKAVDWSDYLAVVGYAFSMAFMGGALGIDARRRGRHLWDISILEYYESTELENIASIMYCIGVLFSKLSILFLFMKVFVPVREGLVYWTNLLLIYLNAAFYIGGAVALICQCIPRAKISNPLVPGHCTNVYLSFMLSGVWNVLSDFFILVFPMWAIWHLHMPLKRKLGITIVFAAGAFALGSSVMRLYSTSQIAHNPDVTWIICKVAMWSSAEMCTVLLCGSFPFLPKLVRSRKEQSSSEAIGPSLEHLNGSGRGSKSSPKHSVGTVSEVEHAGIVKVMHGLPQPMPTWKGTEKWDDDMYSPV